MTTNTETLPFNIRLNNVSALNWSWEIEWMNGIRQEEYLIIPIGGTEFGVICPDGSEITIDGIVDHSDYWEDF